MIAEKGSGFLQHSEVIRFFFSRDKSLRANTLSSQFLTPFLSPFHYPRYCYHHYYYYYYPFYSFFSRAMFVLLSSFLLHLFTFATKSDYLNVRDFVPGPLSANLTSKPRLLMSPRRPSLSHIFVPLLERHGRDISLPGENPTRLLNPGCSPAALSPFLATPVTIHPRLACRSAIELRRCHSRYH